jgi:hypothetical protein
MYDIVLCTLPFVNIDHIYSGPAVLKGALVQHGFKVKTIDFGCDLFKLCNKDAEKLYKVQNYFLTPNKCIDFDDQLIIDNFYKFVVDVLKNNPARFIGISVFSEFTHKATFEILTRIREQNIQSYIVVGGRGLKKKTWRDIHNDQIKLTSLEKTLLFAEFLKKRNLADYTIIGDGEEALIELLRENSHYTNTLEDNVSDFFRNPIADYTDYNFQDYVFYNGEVNLPIVGSKGCVRKCDFCDTGHHLGKFRVRSGIDIAKEMIELSERWQVNKFMFADNLVNGSVTAFMDFIKIIAEYNQKNPEKKIKWTGPYICRPADQIPKDMYKLISLSGGEGLVIGAESGSNAVLKAMDKKTTVEALLTELENFRKHNITCVLLTFVGHWSETWQDFIEHCKMIIKVSPYNKSGTVSAISLGYQMTFLHGSPADNNSRLHDIEQAAFSPDLIWKCKKNPTNTFKERIYRRLIVTALAEKLKLITIQDLEPMQTFNMLIDKFTNEINEFYEQCD